MSQFPGYFTNDPADRYLATGKQLLEMRRFQEALEQLSKYVGECPEDPVGHYHLARGLYGLKNYHQAILRAEHALSINPNCYEPFYIMGLCNYKMGNWELAVIQFKQAIQLEPKVPEVWLAMATPFMHKENWEKVEECIDEVLKISPENPVAYNYKAQISLQKGDLDSAKHHISFALSKEPQRALHHTVAGQIEGLSGKDNFFQLHFNAAIGAEPEQTGHRVRYLNTIFERNKLSAIYPRSCKWGLNKFKHCFDKIIIFAVIYCLLSIMEDEEVFERLDKYVFSLGLLVFMIYSAFPTIFKFIKNRQLWGNHGVNLKDDIFNATLFSLGLSILASGCYKLDSSLKLIGALVLTFTILQDYRSKIINKDLKSVLFLLLCLIPIIIGISVSKLMGIGIQYTRFSPIILFAIIAISLITFISSLRRLNNSK